MKVHRLKILPEYFRPLATGRKRFEIRKDDRDFQMGDELELCEWEGPEKGFTGSEILAEIVYILRGSEHLAPGYCALGIELESIQCGDERVIP